MSSPFLLGAAILRAGQEKVDQAQGFRGEAWRRVVGVGKGFRLPAQNDVCAVVSRSLNNLSRGAFGGDREQRIGGAHGKPAVLAFVVALEVGVQVRAGAHES